MLLLLQDLLCCFRTWLFKCPTQTYRATVGSSWVIQLYSSHPSPSCEALSQACSLPVTTHTRWPILGQVMVLCASCFGREEPWIGWDLHLWAIHLTYHISVSSPLKCFVTPQPHASTFFLTLTCTTCNITSPPLQEDDTLALILGDEFFFLVAAKYLSRRGVHIIAFQWATQTALFWRHVLCDVQKSLRKRKKEQCVVRSCSTH